MAYITVDELQTFQNKFVDEEEQTLLAMYCNSGMEKVKEYLGYNPEKQSYTTKKRGDNGTLLNLEAPVISITSAKKDDDDIDVDKLNIAQKNYIEYKDLSVFDGKSFYEVTYDGGYEEVPSSIKTCALQIASLYWESAGGNLAVSSTTFADTGSRVFNNFQADRFLASIESYRIIKF